MNIVFMGTPDFAVPSLENIVKNKFNVVGVFTQPDRPSGRGYKLTPPAVKVTALKNDIKVYQPKKIKDSENIKTLKNLNPDVIVVVAYGQILSKEILEIPKYGCINVHGSLLPKYRGAAPIQWAVINGEAETGVTTMQMDVGLDTGDMLLKKATKIKPNETAGELHDRLSKIGADLIVETLNKTKDNTIIAEKQDDSLSTYASMLDKSMCEINWNKESLKVHNKIRGLSPWPVATSKLNGNRIRIFESKIGKGNGKPGEVVSTTPLTIACKTGAVEIHKLQQDGKRRMKSEDFLLGNKIEKGQMFK